MMNRNSNTSNPIMYKAARLYVELSTAEAFMKDLKGTLGEMNEESDFRTKIGKSFISNMPKFKILEKDADEVKQKLRKVCSGEIKIEEAIHGAKVLLGFIQEAKLALDDQLLAPYILEVTKN